MTCTRCHANTCTICPDCDEPMCGFCDCANVDTCHACESLEQNDQDYTLEQALQAEKTSNLCGDCQAYFATHRHQNGGQQ